MCVVIIIDAGVTKAQLSSNTGQRSTEGSVSAEHRAEEDMASVSLVFGIVLGLERPWYSAQGWRGRTSVLL